MDRDDADRFDNTSLCLLGLADGVTCAVLLATFAAIYALIIDAWM